MSLCADAFCQATLPDFTTTLGTTLIASSQADFNGVQGFRNWYYGEYAAFSANSFTQLPTFTGFVHQAGQAFNTPYLSATGGHPGVNNLSWAVRRWISSFSGTVNLRLRFFDTNTGCGDGANVRVFNGTTQVWDYQGIPGNMQTFDIPVTIACGDRLDFVIDPRFDAGCDDAFFTVEITSANSASATDNCGIASVTQSPAALSSAPVGATPVSLTATDVNGNSASCSFNVTVVDQIAPVISCPANISMNNDPGQCSAAVSYATPVGTDNCPGASTSQTAGLASGSNFPVGTTTNTFVVTAGGGTATCSFTVTVNDNEAPAISCPANISVNNDPGQCSAAVSYAAPVGTDNCPGASTSQTAGLASGSNFPVGTTTNTFVVTAVGGTATCSFTVTVTDNEAPAISCPANVSVNNDPGQCSAAVSYTAPVGTDNCPGASTSQTAGLASGQLPRGHHHQHLRGHSSGRHCHLLLHRHGHRQ
jgi:hypothetical protein